MTELLQTIRQYIRTPAAQLDQLASDRIQQEIAFHVGERTLDLMSDGMPPDEARLAALKRFGDVDQVVQQCRQETQGGLALLHRIHLAVTALLAVSVAGLFAFFLIDRQSHRSVATLPAAITSLIDNDWSGDVAGDVQDSHGNPIAGATVIVSVKAWPDESFNMRSYRTTTGQQGRFTLSGVTPQRDYYEVNVVALMDGWEMQSQYVTQTTGGQRAPLRFTLEPATRCLVHFKDESGRPLSGVQVRLKDRIASSGEEHFLYPGGARHVTLVSDDAGRISAPWFKTGDRVALGCRYRQEDWQTVTCSITAPTINVCLTDGAFVVSKE